MINSLIIVVVIAGNVKGYLKNSRECFTITRVKKLLFIKKTGDIYHG